MSRSSRTANRLILIVIGLAWLAFGAWMLLRTLQPDLLAPVQPNLDALGSLQIFGWVVDWPLVSVVVGAIMLVLALLFTFTRGRGRVSEAAVLGPITVDKNAVQQLFSSLIGKDPDVVDASVQPWIGRGKTRSWRIAVTVRTGARLDEVVDRVADAARQTRLRLGVAAPIVVHLGGGLKAAVAHSKRAE